MTESAGNLNQISLQIIVTRIKGIMALMIEPTSDFF